MDDEMKPCPFCGSTQLALIPEHLDREPYVECLDCSACGPEAFSDSVAVDLWNNATRSVTT